VSRILKKHIINTGKYAVYLYTAIFILSICLCWIDHLNLFSLESIFFGLSYFPPLWFILFIVPSIGGALLIRNKRLALSVSIIYIIFFLLYGDISLIKPAYKVNKEKGKKISVLALNIQYYNHGLKKVIREIKNINADITLLSENILKEDELKYVRSELSPWQFLAGKPEETAVISKYPVISWKEIELPSHEASLWGGNRIETLSQNPHRSFIHAVINIKGTRVNAISIRFIAGRAESEKMGEQLKWGRYIVKTQIEEVKFFKEYLSEIEGPIIFGGDLNVPPNTHVIKELNQIAIDGYMATNLYGKPTFNTACPFLRLDYIYSIDLIPINSKVLDIVISDHYPLYAEFLLSK